MKLFEFLLLASVLFPLLVHYFSSRERDLRGSFMPFMNFILFILLSIWCFNTKAPLELTITNYFVFFKLSLKLDVLSGLIGATVSLIGAVVVRYSLRYMEDDPHKEKFLRQLSSTISCILLLLMATNFVVFLVAWAGASYFLHQLLTHFSNRSQAIKAANQKFWISRLGDFFIISASFLILWKFNSLEFSTIFKLIQDPVFQQKNEWYLHLISILLVLGSMTKSAQYPFHYWLPNTMDAPTPVSALMHAGIINAGGYLVIRMSPLLSNSPWALSILAIVGSFTAFFSSIVMFAQPNIKKSLAYSTIAQMGFMMLQCGLGFYYMAVVHIIGHSFYKAYSFLSSGTASDLGRLNRYFPRYQRIHRIWILITVPIVTLGFLMGMLVYFQFPIYKNLSLIVLLVIFSLAITQIIINFENKIWSILYISTMATMYILLSFGMNQFLNDIVSTNVMTTSGFNIFVVTICSFTFVILYFIQNNFKSISNTEMGKRIYVKALKGGI